ncbi:MULTISPECIES: LTA synthase family protein [Clostridium]|uniref:LTA synthase family protein n=1 Tax=Clostridium TaxID=1485 RepID=UPI00115B9507|nr:MULTISPECIES: LTA synthase family protein [Clostridium]MDB1968069.1 LTA synthase family protein [Clostridium tertium]MDU1276891.1 LTA synthase family protein [Clostridium sp.]MDU1565965.1 LTA synthase family protein [Clostridium sp.]MDU2458799.1 LTA synthase family protein [Clostridium sp.]MDU3406094.1 LTA synthase family protein [Clostridium sp.]
MKEKFKKIVLNNWLFILMVLILQAKSMLLLSMLRTTNSSSINFSTMYFGVPAIGAHLVIITLILSIMFLFKYKGKMWTALIINVIITILFIADIWYYRNNGTFLSIRHLLHPEIFNPIGKNLINFRPVDLLFVIDFIVFFILFKFDKLRKYNDKSRLSLRILKTAIVFSLSALIIFISHYIIDIKGTIPGQSFLRLSWAPFQTFSDMSPLGYHGFDLKYFVGRNKELSDSDINDVQSWINNNKEDIPDNEYFGMLKGKNLIAIQVESLENFVINKKVYGQEITPTLNKLLSGSLYFDNIYEQNNSGTSSDCDLMVNTSIFPIRATSTFPTYPWTKYNSLQNILNNEGYTTISTHAELPGSWNWAEPHKSFGADKLWDINEFNIDEVIGPGLSDESYLKQIANKIKSENQPFYTFIATLTSHGPFEMPEDKKLLNLPKELDDNMLGGYFQSVRYADEAIKLFIEELEKNGQLDNTVLMIYGDHGGVHKFYEEEIKDAPLNENWWQENDKKIPFIIYNKDLKATTISKAGGQVDFLPTISYLLGVERSKFDNTSMGRVLVNTNRNATILNNGDIMGTPKDENEEKHLKDVFKIADDIIEGNYFKVIDK